MKTSHSTTKNSHETIQQGQPFNLSRREKEIVQLIAKGWATKQIASQLWISNHTVNSHRKNLIRKTDSRNTIEMVLACLRKGLLAFLMVIFGMDVLSAQSIAINNDGSLPNASALLDLKSQNKGILIPRMTSTEVTNILSPAAGISGTEYFVMNGPRLGVKKFRI